MQLRQKNPDLEINAQAREIVGPFIPEVGRLNDEAARLVAIYNRPHLTEAESSEVLRRAAQGQAALMRIERQLEGALHGLPSEIGQHSRIHDLRAAIAAVRSRLEQLGAA
jgi:hypothetical protein